MLVSISLGVLVFGLELLPYLAVEIFHQGNLGGLHPPRLSTVQDDNYFLLKRVFIEKKLGIESFIGMVVKKRCISKLDSVTSDI